MGYHKYFPHLLLSVSETFLPNESLDHISLVSTDLFGFYWFIWFLRLCLALMTFVASRSPGPMFYRITLSFSPGKAKIRRGGVYFKKYPHLNIMSSVHTKEKYLLFGSRFWMLRSLQSRNWDLIHIGRLSDTSSPVKGEQEYTTVLFSFHFGCCLACWLYLFYFIPLKQTHAIQPRLDPKCHPCLYIQGWDYRSIPPGSYKIASAILSLRPHDFLWI